MFSWTFIRRIWERPTLRAALATLPVLAVTALLFFEVRHSERLLVETETSRQADNAFLQLQSFVGRHVGTLENVGSYVQAVPEGTADRNFIPFVQRLLNGRTDFESIVWREGTGAVRQSVNAPGDLRALATTPPALLTAAERKAGGGGQTIATPGFEILPGQEATTVVVPLTRGGQGAGSVEGTVRLTRGMQELFGRDVSDFWNLEIYDRAGNCVFRALAPGQTPPRPSLIVERHVPIADHAWKLRIWPTPLLIASVRTGAPWRILWIGLVTTALLALANYLLTQHQARLAESLRESERLAADVDATRKHLSDLVNGVDAAIWESDAATGHFTFINDYARKLLRAAPPAQEAGPDFWLSHVYPDDRERASANARAVQRPGETCTEEYRLLDEAGETLWVREIITGIGTDGRITGRRGVVVDITARVQAEEALRQSQKLESLGVLAGGIAHDFNNLLTTILGNAEMLKPFLEGRSTAGQEHLEKIERTTRRLAELTRQMLAYSGRGRFRVERIDLNAVIREMTELLAVSTPKNVRVAYRLDPALPPMEGAATQIRQVILNLLTNAAEAIGDAPDGSVILRTGTLDLLAETIADEYPEQTLEPGHYLRLEVSDNGCGMSEATLSKIFDPFFTTKFTGRGLGLAALRGIVRGHHGGIQISSHPGEGTVFTLIFPVSTVRGGAVTPTANPLATASGLQGKTVLVVDDEDGLRALMVAALEAAGCTVYEGFDGADGWERFEAHRDEIDVVVLDVTMPRLSGDEVFRRIRAQRPEMLVILCSGYTEEEIVNRFDGQGLAAFIEKPFKPSELVAKVGAVLAEAARSRGELLPAIPPPARPNGTHKNGRKIPAIKT